MEISILVVQGNVDNCRDCKFEENDFRFCEADKQLRPCPKNGIPYWCPGLADNEINRIRASLAEVEARLIEHANNSANAATELLDVRGQLAEVENERDELRLYMEKLSCIGNGDRPGNSIGNQLARKALAKLKEKKS